MAKKPTKPEAEKLWTRVKWKGFVNVKITDAEKKAIKANLLPEASGLEFLINAATDGYKCSISYSIPEDVFTVSLTGQYREKPNSGITMSIRHREMIVALSALSFVQEQLGTSQEWSDKYTLVGDDDW